MSGFAGASYHQNLIREVHNRTGIGNDFVVLQAYAPGENLVAGKHIVTYDGGGNPFSSFTIPANVANGANQATILISNGGVTGADFTATAGPGTDGAHLEIVNNGSVCFTDSSTAVGLDCVSFGLTPMAPLPSPAGTPALAGGGLADDQSALRTLSRGCATQLDPADDTNNSAADFAVGPLFGRNNSAPISEKPCFDPSCPNATIKGTDGNDVIRGTKKKDVIDALGGNDTIRSLNRKDIVCGGFGNDVIRAGNAKDKLFGGAGNDTLLGGKGKDRMNGGEGTDTCNGGAGKDKALNCESGQDAKKGSGPKSAY